MDKFITIEHFCKVFDLKIVAGKPGIQRKITDTDIHRPGLQLAGFYTKFPEHKIQLIGNQESYYLKSLNPEERESAIKFYMDNNPLCIIITKSHDTANFESLCNETGTPLLSTPEGSQDLTEKIINYLEKELSKEVGIHGVCINVFGVGILLRGDSGIGKSEAALSLINKGHRLISDDLVILKKIGPSALIATHNEVNKHFLSLRGIGLVNIPKVYGFGSIQDETKINLDIKLTFWDDSEYYDAIQAETKYIDYLDAKIKHIEIPIRPGRDIAELVEVAAKQWRLEQEGYNAFEDFQNRLRNNE